MSKFSVYLKELLDQRGEPIARVAKNIGIERTSIHKALKDERILSYTAVKQLARYFQLTLPQVRELNQYYEMLLQGEDIYRIQEAICELLSELSQLHFSSYHHIEQETAVLDLNSMPGLIHGKHQVESTIQTIFQWEAEASECAEMILYLPADCSLTDSLVRLWRTAGSYGPSDSGVPSRPFRHRDEDRKSASAEKASAVVPGISGKLFCLLLF